MPIKSSKTMDGELFTIMPSRVLQLFGAIFALSGLAALVGAIIDGTKDSAGQSTSPAVAAVMCLMFILPGVGFIAYRGRLLVDERRQQVVRSHWLLITLKQKVWPLHDALSVTIHREVRSSGSGSNRSSKTVYPVSLVYADDKKELIALGEPITARRLAEAVARAAEISFENSIGQETIVREPEQLDWSLRQHILAEGPAPIAPEPAPGSRLKVQRDGQRYTASLPPIGLMKSGLVLLLPGIPMLAMMLAFVFSGDAKGPPVFFIIFAFLLMGVPIAAIAFWMVHRGIRRTEVAVDPEQLTIRRLAPWWRTEARMAADAVEELSLRKGGRSIFSNLVATGGLIVITDHAMHEFGRGLTEDEAEQLADLIRHAVCQ